jgi:hypothetical protein
MPTTHAAVFSRYAAKKIVAQSSILQCGEEN